MNTDERTCVHKVSGVRLLVGEQAVLVMSIRLVVIGY